METKLVGRSVLVTGAGRGLGAAIAAGLASRGARVAIGVRDLDRGRSVADVLNQRGQDAFAVKLDITDSESVNSAVAQVIDRNGSIEGLVNNAGVIERKPSIDTSRVEFLRVLDTNLVGSFEASVAVARSWFDSGVGGSIVNISSVLQESGGVKVASYASSKGGLKQLTRTLSSEWASDGIRVNAVAAGYFTTDLTAPLRADSKRTSDLLARIPVGRFGEPSEIVGPVAFLLSDEASYITGASLEVDGGWIAS